MRSMCVGEFFLASTCPFLSTRWGASQRMTTYLVLH
jgi:hypothetical protein